MFVESRDHPFMRYLEAHHATIHAESLGIPRGAYYVWSVEEAYQGSWRVFPILSQDSEWLLADEARRNGRRCPRTTEILRRIPGLLMAGFSLLEPGTHIYPHADEAPMPTVRCHLGLAIPEGGGMRAEGEVRRWREGRCLGFESGEPHESANTSDRDRVVLLVDVDAARARQPVPGWREDQAC